MTALPIPSASGNKVYIGPRPDGQASKLNTGKLSLTEVQKLAAYQVDAAKFDSLKIKTAIVFISEKELAAKPIAPFYTERNVNVILFPIPEGGVPPSTEKVKELVEQMLKALTEGNVYMHCGTGTGRTGLMVACGIVLTQKLSAKNAFNLTGQLIPAFNLSHLQRAFLVQFSEACGNKEAVVKKVATPAPAGKAAPAPSSLSSVSSAEVETDPAAEFVMVPFDESAAAPVISASSSAGPAAPIVQAAPTHGFEKYEMPFTSDAGFKLYAGPSPKVYKAPKKHEDLFKTAAVLLSDAEKIKHGTQAYYSSKNITQISLPIPDMGTPDSFEAVDAFIESVFKALEEGNVYMHCGLGKGRTGLMLACMAVRKKGMTGEDAIVFTHGSISGSLTSASQREYVKKYYNDHVKQPSGS